MKKVSIGRFFVFYAIFSCLSNVIHPITPTMFKNIGFPDYMFGVSFAAMAFAMFLFSPYWGKTGDKIGHAKVYAISAPLYAISQFCFGIAPTPMLATIARLFSGFFSAGVTVASMAYVVNNTTMENRGKMMSYYAAINSVFSAFGYFIGGVFGNISIMGILVMQLIALFATGIAANMLLGDPESVEIEYTYNVSSNPFKAFTSMKDIMSAALVAFLVTVFLTSFATTSYDNAFNYYLKDALNLSSSYNGVIKAIIGIISLVVNFTLNIYLINKTDIRKSIAIVLGFCGITAMLVPFIQNIALFFAGNIIYFMFNAIYLPIQQVLVTKGHDSKTSGIISGVFNSVKSVGMIFGALFAGFVYAYGNLLPFITAAGAFVLAAGLSYYNYKKYES